MIYQLMHQRDVIDALPERVATRLSIHPLLAGDVLTEGVRSWPVQDDDILINRLTNSRLHDRREYAALALFISRFNRVVAQPGLYDLADDCLPLPVQWERLKKVPSLTTPRYHFSVKFDVGKSFERTLTLDPFEFYRWSPRAQASSQARWNALHVESPEGRPILLSLIGTVAEYTWLDSGERVQSGHIRKSIDAAYTEIRSAFPFVFGEVLLFQSDRGLMFWMISNSAVLSSQYKFWDGLLGDGLTASLEAFHA